MESNEFRSVDDILSDVVSSCDDVPMKMGISKGQYISFIQNAVEEMALDSFYDNQNTDFDIDPRALRIPIPANMFNIKRMYVYNGECAQPTDVHKVWYKRNYDNSPMGGTAHTDNRTENQPMDPFEAPFLTPRWGPTDRNLFYANVKGGYIMLSAACNTFKHLKVFYNGFGVEQDKAPAIPRILSNAIKDFATERALRILKIKDRTKYGVAWKEQVAILTDPYDGSWDKAIRRITKMDAQVRDSYREYMSRGNW